MTISFQPFVHDPLTTIGNEETSIQDLLEILQLKNSNAKIPKKYFLDTTNLANIF